MIPDWKTTCVYFSRLLAARYPVLCKRLLAVLRSHGVPVRFLEGTRDIWARDYCPIQADRRLFIKFRYYPDYLRGRYEDSITEDDTVCEQLNRLDHFRRVPMILDGGNVVHSQAKAILTDKVFADNQDIPPDQMINRLLGGWILSGAPSSPRSLATASCTPMAS